jgi:RNA polymerase sigma-54 factor
MTTLSVSVGTQVGAQLRTYATLLPLGVRDLDDTIAREAAENPWLELVDRPVFGLTDGDFRIAAAGPSLAEHLLLQLEARGFFGNVLRAAQHVIGSLDEHAYLREDAAQIARLTHVGRIDAERAIELVQDLEPSGVAARSLGERFRLQLAHAGETASLAFNLTSEGPVAFAAQRGLTSAEFSRALQRLRACDPDPARDFGCAAERVYPEMIIARDGDRLTASVDRRFWPDVRLVSLEVTRGLSAPMRHARSRARLVVDALARRQTTLERLAITLLEHQRAYFLSDGATAALLPLSGRELAREVGCAESTISRALADRYAATPFGTIPLRALLMRRPGSTGVTVFAAHEHIRALAQRAPNLSDDAIARALRLRGVRLARRTVAKYRRELGLASSRGRGPQ